MGGKNSLLERREWHAFLQSHTLQLLKSSGESTLIVKGDIDHVSGRSREENPTGDIFPWDLKQWIPNLWGGTTMAASQGTAIFLLNSRQRLRSVCFRPSLPLLPCSPRSALFPLPTPFSVSTATLLACSPECLPCFRFCLLVVSCQPSPLMSTFILYFCWAFFFLFCSSWLLCLMYLWAHCICLRLNL